MRPSLRIPFLTIVATVLSFSFAASADAQKRDHLTDAESELVRFHQELDKRIEVFIRAIDRRWAIINGVEQVKTKSIVKGEPHWGEPPKGTRAQLLSDIAALLDEAITNIDDVSQHDEKNPLISRSLRRLTTAVNGYVTQLNALRTGTKDPDELAAIERSLDHASQILEVGNQLPPPSADKKKKNDP
jgi:hypothetical protein